MCGIAGIFGQSRIDREALDRMGGKLAHRGPDDGGLWIDQSAGIGLCHRRLAVVDLTPAGQQPMISANGRHVLTFNGEIYNHRDLRAEIDARSSVAWRGHCDTETLLEAISLWGLGETLQRCAGMFALGLWDRQERHLTLARDRFGEKPLYFGYIGNDLVFASELPALTAHSGFQGRIDRVALAKLAARGYIPSPHSIFEGVHKLDPAAIVTITSSDTARRRIPAIERYWSYRTLVRKGHDAPIRSERDALAQLDEVIGNAVQAQQVADVPVGLFLSGGIDSSTILALHRAKGGGDIRTYSVSFADTRYDEGPFARAVSAHFQAQHHELRVDAADALALVPRMGSIYGEPFGDPSGIPTFLLSQMAREQVTVALTGDGADELFGGYTRYRTAARLRRTLSAMPPRLRKSAGQLLGSIPPSRWDSVSALTARRAAGRGAWQRLQRTFHRFATSDNLTDIYRSFRDEWTGEGSPVLGVGEACGTDDLRLHDDDLSDIEQMMFCDAVSYLPGDVLCKVDRATMACGLEARAPFLDHRVAEVAARIGQTLKVDGKTNKVILRKLLYRYAPASLFERPKAGFTVPVGEWLRGPLKSWADDLLSPSRLAREGYFDAGLIARLWQDHVQGRRDAGLALWAILMFQSWREDLANERIPGA